MEPLGAAAVAGAPDSVDAIQNGKGPGHRLRVTVGVSGKVLVAGVGDAGGVRQRVDRVVCGRGVESTTGAVAVGGGGSCSRRLSPMPVPHSSPWLRFQSPLVEPDVRISRIRLSDEIMPSPTGSSPYAAQGA